MTGLVVGPFTVVHKPSDRWEAEVRYEDGGKVLAVGTVVFEFRRGSLWERSIWKMLAGEYGVLDSGLEAEDEDGALWAKVQARREEAMAAREAVRS